jgi:hypothetical protein
MEVFHKFSRTATLLATSTPILKKKKKKKWQRLAIDPMIIEIRICVLTTFWWSVEIWNSKAIVH